MRLGASLLSLGLAVAGSAGAQAPKERRLPWESGLTLPPWQALDAPAGEPPSLVALPGNPRRDLRVQIAPDGRLRCVDRRGVLRLSLGLPGRVTRLWKDGGVPLDAGAGEHRLSPAGPLARGVGELPWEQADLRPGLEGLLWILDDSERVLTLVHPATGRVQYLALPPLTEPDLAFWPDHLELLERPGAEGNRTIRRRWTLPWTGLLPALLKLAQAPSEGRHGTAFKPYPKE